MTKHAHMMAHSWTFEAREREVDAIYWAKSNIPAAAWAVALEHRHAIECAALWTLIWLVMQDA